MNELINIYGNRATIRRKLLSGTSALALVTYASCIGLARAEDTDRPELWIELGGQLEALQGSSSPFTADFMHPAVPPGPSVYGTRSFDWKQSPSRFALGGEVKVTIQPKDSDWLFSAGVRYGRSHSNRHTHYQNTTSYPAQAKYVSAFSDTLSESSEQHFTIDFSAGKDVGLGLFGNNGSSVISAGVRFAQFSSKSQIHISARPNVGLYSLYKYRFPTFDEFHLTGHQARSFTGIGPSLTWNASAALVGNPEEGELTLDWGLSGALLFGRQKAKIDHASHAFHYQFVTYYQQTTPLYTRDTNPPARSRRGIVPNLGGLVGLSVKYPNAKISLGYRADFFFGAVDAGIDARHTKNLGFNGPFATISIGLGG